MCVSKELFSITKVRLCFECKRIKTRKILHNNAFAGKTQEFHVMSKAAILEQMTQRLCLFVVF
jgi:hypothetical protein